MERKPKGEGYFGSFEFRGWEVQLFDVNSTWNEQANEAEYSFTWKVYDFDGEQIKGQDIPERVWQDLKEEIEYYIYTVLVVEKPGPEYYH